MLSIVNDGSTDDSAKVLLDMMVPSQEFETEDKDHVIVGECQGLPTILIDRPKALKQAAARNVAIEQAWQNADLFFPLDADDIHLPGKIRKSVDVWLTNTKFIGLVYSDVIIHDERDGTRVREFRKPYNRKELERSNTISNSPLISKMALTHAGLYDVNLPPCEDWDMWLRITENFIAMHIPEPLQEYTTTGKNCSFTLDTAGWDEKRAIVLNKMLERTKRK